MSAAGGGGLTGGADRRGAAGGGRLSGVRQGRVRLVLAVVGGVAEGEEGLPAKPGRIRHPRLVGAGIAAGGGLLIACRLAGGLQTGGQILELVGGGALDAEMVHARDACARGSGAMAPV